MTDLSGPENPDGARSTLRTSVRASAYRAGIRDWVRGVKLRDQPPGYLEGWHSIPLSWSGLCLFEP